MELGLWRFDSSLKKIGLGGSDLEERLEEILNADMSMVPPNWMVNFHIPISNDLDNTDFQGMVVEMIPQNRPDTWTLANLKQVENNRQLVMVTGALFYDNFHFVNADPSSPRGGQPHRFSLWEAHPLTQFVVCTKPDNFCEPSRAGDWMPLGVAP